MPLRPGTRLGPYEVLALLGAGGMGEVYRARDTRLNREVAVKVLPERLAGEPEALARFRREAQAIAALSHPNILAIHDFGEVAYAVTELLEGETLQARLGKDLPSIRETIDYALQIARGLMAAHARGVVHRDLKPGNVFITSDGHVKILDFGLARFSERAGSTEELSTVSRHTTPGVIMGTVSYMSPEQVRGQSADHRSDVFSLGVVLYEMLGGHRPFQGDTGADTMSAILIQAPQDLSRLRPGIPPSLDRVVRRCLEKAVGDRFQSSRDLVFALETISDARAPATSVAAPDRSHSIAVLPFTNMSPDPEQEYFCEGIAEEIINALTKIEGLRVASRTSAFQFKGKAQDIRRIGAALNVKTVLEGSVRAAGKRLRITVQLVNVDDGYHLWSERYDREMEDVFAIQDDIASSIVDALRLRLATARTAESRRPADLEAYQLYLKGQHHWYRRERGSIGRRPSTSRPCSLATCGVVSARPTRPSPAWSSPTRSGTR
jgi:serine/threonine protein kinase